LCRFDQHLNECVIEGREHSAIKLRFGGKHAAGDRRPLGCQANKLFSAIGRVADSLDVSAPFQAVE
jgi:hypothetical protein